VVRYRKTNKLLCFLRREEFNSWEVIVTPTSWGQQLPLKGLHSTRNVNMWLQRWPLILIFFVFSMCQDCQQRHLLKGMLPLVHTVSCGPAQLSRSALLGSILSLWKDHWWRHTPSWKLGLCFPQEGEFQQVNFGQEIQQGLSEHWPMKRY